MKNSFYKFFFLTFILVQSIYLIIALCVPSLPGWKMFITLNQTKIEIQDSSQNDIDIEKYLPHTMYDLSLNKAERISTFICKKNISPYIYAKINNGKYFFAKPECLPQKDL